MIGLIKSTFFDEANTKEELVKFIRESKTLSMGSECKKFEKTFAEKQGRKFAIFVSSGSMANLILLQALLNSGKLKRGDKVGVSALTWSTNIMPVIQLGLVPVVIDCGVDTLNVSPENLVKAYAKEKLKAFFITHVLGFSDDVKKIQKFCKKNRIVLLEDTCESLGTVVAGKKLGNYGLASTFSTFVGHHFSTIEGGVICTDDKNLAEQMIVARAHGWDRNLDSISQEKIRKKNKINGFFAKYTFYDLAFNGRPTEIQGFIGNLTLPHWDEIVAKRQANYKLFTKAVESNPDFLPLRTTHLDIESNFAMPVICKNSKVFNFYREKFEKAGVEIRPIIAGNMMEQPFMKKYVKKNYKCPNASFLHENGFYFGNNHELTEEELSILVGLLKK